MSRGFVVVGVDTPETSGDAVAWGARAASLHGATLRMVHAVEGVAGLPIGVVGAEDRATRALLRDHTDALTVLDRAVAAVRAEFPDVAVEPIEVVGDNVKSLLAYQQDALLVVGTGRRSTLTERVLGSTSLGVAMHASCPVAVVPPGSRRDGDPLGVVGVAVDGSADSALAARVACYEARARGARVTATNTWALEIVDGYVVTESDPEIFQTIQERQRGIVEQALASARRDYADVEVQVEVVHGRAVTTLLERSKDVDLLVMGSRGVGGFAGKLLGSVSQRVLRGAACPVIIVKASST